MRNWGYTYNNKFYKFFALKYQELQCRIFRNNAIESNWQKIHGEINVKKKLDYESKKSNN